jgi:hypothetical protein
LIYHSPNYRVFRQFISPVIVVSVSSRPFNQQSKMASTPSAANQGEPPRADDPVVESLPVVKLFPIVVA